VLEKIKFMLKQNSIAFFGLMVLSAVSGTVQAAVVVDGVMNELDTYTDSKDLQWYNDHNSSYTLADNLFNRMYYTNDTINGMLNVFIEVPIYARNMIWTGNNPSDSNDDFSDQDYVAYYLEGTHHTDQKRLDHENQTGSEYFRLNGTGSLFGEDLCFGVQDDGGHCDHGSDGVTTAQTNPTSGSDLYWQTSNDYLLDDGICTTSTLCEAYDQTMSIEIQFASLGLGDGAAIIESITSLRLHLSDEMVGLPITQPPIATPVPAAFWLFGTAMAGLFGARRKAKNTA